MLVAERHQEKLLLPADVQRKRACIARCMPFS